MELKPHQIAAPTLAPDLRSWRTKYYFCFPMNPTKSPSELTDLELATEARSHRKSAILHAVGIGFLAGIILYSVFTQSWSLLTLIPLYLIYLMLKGSNQERSRLVREEMKRRRLGRG